MRNLTLGQAKETIARVLGVCSSDSRVAEALNEAQERLLNRSSKPVGSLMRYRFCVSEGCITLPRQVRSVEAFAICESPGIVTPEWHEFIGNGTTLWDDDDMPGRRMVDHGRAVAFNDVDPGESVTAVAVTAGGSGYTSAPTVVFTNDSDDTTGTGAAGTATVVAGAVTAVTMTDSGSGYTEAPTVSFTGGGGTGATAAATIARNRKIRVVSSVAETAGLEILLQGYDSNGQWVRTLDGASYIDGELVAISNVATNSVTTWSSLVRVVKPVTSGIVRLYTWDSTVSIVQRSLAVYEPSETVPVYRKMFIPGLANMSGCSDSSSACESKSITALVKLQHVPVSVDNDFFVIGNLAALKLMVMAIQREEANRYDEAGVLEGKAVAEIEGELSSYLGDGQVIRIRAEDKDLFGAGIVNMI